MSWLGILLIGFAVTDLTHAVRRIALPARVRGRAGGAVCRAAGGAHVRPRRRWRCSSSLLSCCCGV